MKFVCNIFFETPKKLKEKKEKKKKKKEKKKKKRTRIRNQLNLTSLHGNAKNVSLLLQKKDAHDTNVPFCCVCWSALSTVRTQLAC